MNSDLVRIDDPNDPRIAHYRDIRERDLSGRQGLFVAEGKVVLNALVDETLFLLKHHQRFKRLTVVRELDMALPASTGNAEQLTQVLMALMLNAVDAVDDRGRLTVRTGRNPALADEVFVEMRQSGATICSNSRTSARLGSSASTIASMTICTPLGMDTTKSGLRMPPSALWTVFWLW